MKLLLLALISLLFFSGCSNKEAEIIIQKEIVVKYILPPISFSAKANVPEPINKEAYLNLNFKDKEKELGLYIVELLTIINIENDKKDKVLEYIKEKERIQ